MATIKVATRLSRISDKLQRNGYVCSEVINVIDPVGGQAIRNNKEFILLGTKTVDELIANPKDEIDKKYFLVKEDKEFIYAPDDKAIAEKKAKRLEKKKAEDAKALKKRGKK